MRQRAAHCLQHIGHTLQVKTRLTITSSSHRTLASAVSAISAGTVTSSAGYVVSNLMSALCEH